MGSVRLRGVSKFYGAMQAIFGVDLDIAHGELVVFVGPSGCGKSTLLRMIAGLEEVDEGTVEIAGRDVTGEAPARRGVAMVFQNYALYPHMTAFENMAYGLRRAGVKGAELDRRVRAVASMLQIEPLLDRKPAAMSGGQRQRVAIGRAIVREPEVFLFDEPLSNLDAGLRVETRSQIARLHRELGATMIFVTHDQVEAMTLATRIVVLNGGRIEQVGVPRDVYHRPANAFVAGFIGSPAMNLIPAEAGRGALRLETGDVLPWQGAPAEGRLTLGLRPDRLRLAPDGAMGGEVMLVEDLGDEAVLHIRSGGLTLRAKAAATDPPVVGTQVRLAPDLSAAHLFRPDGRRLAAPD